MKICKTIEELKKYAEVNASFDTENLLPSENKVRYIVERILGKAQFAALQTAYTAGGTLSPELAELLPFVQNAMVSLSMIKWVGSCGQVEISDAGIHLNLSKDRKTAFQWQITDIQRHFKMEAYKALENMLHFLWESGPTEYLLWRVSDERKEYLQYFINDSVEFSKHYNIHENFPFFLFLRETMDSVEENYIIPVIGQPLFDEIKQQILAGTVTTNNGKILKYIRKAVANKTIYEAIPKLSSFMDEFGIRENFLSMIMTTTADQPVRNELISLRMNHANKEGETNLLRLKKHLVDNATDYPLFVLPSETSVSMNSNDRALFVV